MALGSRTHISHDDSLSEASQVQRSQNGEIVWCLIWYSGTYLEILYSSLGMAIGDISILA